MGRSKLRRGGKTGFTLLASEQTGALLTNSLEALQSAGNRVLSNGSGVAVGDYDMTVWWTSFVQFERAQHALQESGWMQIQGCHGRGGSYSHESILRGATFADIDGDGNLDLLVATTGGGVICYSNDGHADFLT